VERIAGGDLSVRADRGRNDELGSLAESVNTMTESLLQRDQILESVRFAAEELVRTDRWEEVADDVLAKIGEAADVSLAVILENHSNGTGRLACSLRYEWTAGVIPSQLSNPALKDFSYSENGFERWIEVLGKNECLFGSVSELSDNERIFLGSMGILSLLVIPVFVSGQWWGFLALADSVRDRAWTDAEEGQPSDRWQYTWRNHIPSAVSGSAFGRKSHPGRAGFAANAGAPIAGGCKGAGLDGPCRGTTIAFGHVTGRGHGRSGHRCSAQRG
jgi:hypothetical protein